MKSKSDTDNTAGGGCSSRALFDLLQEMLRDSEMREKMNDERDYTVAIICEALGYGAVMDAAARLWRRKDPIGAFLVGPCIGTVESAVKEYQSNRKDQRP